MRSTGYKNVYCTQLPPPADRGAAPRPTNFFGVADLKLLFALIPAMLFMFFGLAIVVDDFLVPSLEALCKQLHLLEDVAGATLMAAGSSAPELCMGLLAVFWTKYDIGIGTIMGSAIFNILVIIGLSAVLAHDVLDLDFRPLVSDSIVYFSAIVLVLFSVAFFTPGKALWWMGLLLVLGYGDYIVFMKWNDKPYFGHRANRHVRGEEVSWESGTNYGKLNPRSQWHTCLSSAQTTNHVVNSSRSEDEEAIPNRRPLGAPDDNESPV